jgi:hypothetical protein
MSRASSDVENNAVTDRLDGESFRRAPGKITGRVRLVREIPRDGNREK